jgi:tripartite-type tricarboxylate transporter receptor subunit TctC
VQLYFVAVLTMGTGAMRSATKACIGFALLTAITQPIHAQSDAAKYPTQVVRIVVPVSPGSIADGFARMIAEKLADMWKQQVIVENRPGLAGMINVAKSAPDGYTLFLNSNGHTIAGAITKNLPFDPVKDFAGITVIATVPLVMIVPFNSPAKTLKDLVAMAKARPGQLNIANAGVSTTSFLSAEVFKQSARIDVVHVPYRGAPEAVTAVVRGDAHMYFAPIPSAMELGATGKVAVVAVNSPARVPQMPNVPTMVEAGLADFKYESWFGLLAPAGTPGPILLKVNQDVVRVLDQGDIRDRMQKLGALPTTSTQKEFDVIIRDDTARNTKLLRDAGFGAQ